MKKVGIVGTYLISVHIPWMKSAMLAGGTLRNLVSAGPAASQGQFCAETEKALFDE